MNELVLAGDRTLAATIGSLIANYMSGFGNTFETEALPGALPVGRNSPQKVNYGLYAEQLSGSPFTAPQATNQRSWLYRIRPTVRHTGRFERDRPRADPHRAAARGASCRSAQLRWGPTPIPDEKLTFVTGLRTMTTAGDCETHGRHGGACAARHRSRWRASISSTPTASC